MQYDMPHTDIISEQALCVKPSTVTEVVKKAERIQISAGHIRRALTQYLLSEKRADTAHNVSTCGTFLMFKCYADTANTATLEKANFCKHPMCPMCAWRRHIKYSLVLDEALKHVTGKLSHLILAVPNVEQIDRELLMRLKERGKSFVKQKLYCNSYVSNLEIIAGERGYHPHLHILLNTENYFKVSADWIKQMSRKWMIHYTKGMSDRDAYLQQYSGFTFFVRGVQKGAENDAVQELTKYIVKGEIGATDNFIADTARAIKGVRKMSSGGELKKAMQIGKKNTYIKAEQRLQELSGHEWYYEIYQYINGCYERRTASC